MSITSVCIMACPQNTQTVKTCIQTHVHSLCSHTPTHQNKHTEGFQSCQTTKQLLVLETTEQTKQHQKLDHSRKMLTHDQAVIYHAIQTQCLALCLPHTHRHTEVAGDDRRLLSLACWPCCGVCRAVPWCLTEPCSTIGTWQPHG